MNLQQTYNYKAHPISGAQIIERTGLKKVHNVNEAGGKSSLDKWSFKYECEAQKITDSINYFSRATIQRAARRNKRK